MPTKNQVLALYEVSNDYGQVGRTLGIPAGQAYLIATGLPADGGDSHPSDELDRPGVLQTSSQHLVYESAEVENATAKGHVHQWIEHKAKSDLPMQHAAEARDAAPGEVQAPEETDITTVLTRDHDQVVALLKQLKTIPGVSSGGSPTHLSRRKSIVDMVTVALSKHEAAEQEEFWPAVARFFPRGQAVVDLALSQEQEGKDLLHRLGQLDASDEQFDELVMELDKAARKHVAVEDQVLLTISETVAEEVRRELGRAFRRARGHAPTRPHPRAPTKPAAAVKAAGAAAAAVDAVRDQAGDRPATRRGKAAQDLQPRSRPDARQPRPESPQPDPQPAQETP